MEYIVIFSERNAIGYAGAARTHIQVIELGGHSGVEYGIGAEEEKGGRERDYI
jgi:hypothetical protein